MRPIIPQSTTGVITVVTYGIIKAQVAGMMNLPQTVEGIIRQGAARFNETGLFFGHGTDNALDEAAALVVHALRLDYTQLGQQFDRMLTEDQQQQVVALFEQRVASRKPAAYITNEARFAGLPFYIDERVLVPRSPIAELVGDRFSPWIAPDRVRHILDLGTGSGCIAIACALAFPDARVDATDVSAGALDVARKNVQRHQLEEHVRLIEADLLDGLEGHCYDIIVSNPPYVGKEEMQTLPAEYLHEPAQGLAAGHDGLDMVARILKDASSHLSEHGILVVEVGYSQEALEAQYPDIPFLWLEFEFGGEGVFLLERSQLQQYQAVFDRVMDERQLFSA